MAVRRLFEDPHSAILAFLASVPCATFYQVTVFLRWAWYGTPTDAPARERLGKAKRLFLGSKAKLLEQGKIVEVRFWLDARWSRSVAMYVDGAGADFPPDFYERLSQGWVGHGGVLEVDGYHLPVRESEVTELSITRSEPTTTAITLGDALLSVPGTVTPPWALESRWADWTLESDVADWALEPSRSVGQNHLADSRGRKSADHQRRRISIGRYRDGERERVVVVPMVAFWLRGRPEFQRDDEASVMAELRAIREGCRLAGQTLEVWAPSDPLKEK